MTKKYYNVVASFQVTASDKDQAWENFEEQVADMIARGESLIEHFIVEEQESKD